MARLGQVPQSDSLLSLEDQIWEIDSNDIKILGQLGEGNFGAVMKGNYLGTAVAVKKLFHLNDPNYDMNKYMAREIAVLKSLHHPNIVQFIGISVQGKDVCLVTEFISGGDLDSLLANEEIELTWSTRLQIAMELALALRYFASKGLVHRDLKASNILVADGYHVKLCDFGMSRATEKSRKSRERSAMTLCGTQEWMAPEILVHDSFNATVDIFSYGMVLSELITRDIPPERRPENKFQFPLAQFMKEVPPDCPSELVELMKLCIAYDPDDRPDWEEIVTRIQVLHTESKLKEGGPIKKVPSSPTPVANPVTHTKPISVILDEMLIGDFEDEDPAPPKPTPLSANPDKQEYKHYMRDKYRYEEWQNRQVLYKKKLEQASKMLHELKKSDVKKLFLEIFKEKK